MTARPAPVLDDALIARAAGISTATLHEAAGRIGSLPSPIKPCASGVKLAGRAYPVRSPAGDNLWIHRAVYAAAPGDILVVDVSGGYEFGYWGEVLSTAARARDLGGLVIDGGVRDGEQLPDVGFPVFSRPFCIRGTGKDFGALGHLNGEVRIGDVVIAPGDLIVGDGDGVVSISAALAAGVVQKSLERDRQEAVYMERLRQGERTLDIYGLDR